jgi:hypothetical protein
MGKKFVPSVMRLGSAASSLAPTTNVGITFTTGAVWFLGFHKFLRCVEGEDFRGAIGVEIILSGPGWEWRDSRCGTVDVDRLLSLRPRVRL